MSLGEVLIGGIMEQEIKEKEVLTNRQKVMLPKSGRCWCHGCDHALVNDGSKCPYCGKRDVRKRLKKAPK